MESKEGTIHKKMIYAHMGTGFDPTQGGERLRPEQIVEHPAGEQPIIKELPKHNHYYRFVSDLQKMDWYRFCERFDVIHPCAQHAGKKIVFAGQRGAKDIDKDIQEAIDTLVRWQEMRRESK